jgi:mycofactocin precursor
MTAATPEVTVTELVLADESEQTTELVSQDLLVEEVSIDGMCGVY